MEVEILSKSISLNYNVLYKDEREKKPIHCVGVWLVSLHKVDFRIKLILVHLKKGCHHIGMDLKYICFITHFSMLLSYV